MVHLLTFLVHSPPTAVHFSLFLLFSSCCVFPVEATVHPHSAPISVFCILQNQVQGPEERKANRAQLNLSLVAITMTFQIPSVWFTLYFVFLCIFIRLSFFQTASTIDPMAYQQQTFTSHILEAEKSKIKVPGVLCLVRAHFQFIDVCFLTAS